MVSQSNPIQSNVDADVVGSIQAEAEADQELIGDDSYDEVEMSPPSKSSTVGEVETSSVREKIKVFSRSGGSTRGSSSGSVDKMGRDANGMLPGRSPYSRALSRGWSQAEEQEVKARAEQSSTRAREALATFGRSTSNGSRPDNSWVVKEDGGVRGPDTAGGSSSEGGPLQLPYDPEQLAMKRKAFVKQYSQGGASDFEDSDYSLHDNAAAVAVAAAFGKVVSSRTAGNGNGNGYAGHTGGDSALHSADTSFGDAPGIWSEQEEMQQQQQQQRQKDEQRAGGDVKGTPKRGRPSPVKLNGNSNSEGEGHERAAAKAKARHSPAPPYDASKEAIIQMSDSGSPKAEFA